MAEWEIFWFSLFSKLDVRLLISGIIVNSGSSFLPACPVSSVTLISFTGLLLFPVGFLHLYVLLCFLHFFFLI